MYRHPPSRWTCPECQMYGSSEEFAYVGHPCEEPERDTNLWEVSHLVGGPPEGTYEPIASGEAAAIEDAMNGARRVVADAINQQAAIERKAIRAYHKTRSDLPLSDAICAKGDLVWDWWNDHLDAAMNQYVTVEDIAAAEETLMDKPLRLRVEVTWTSGWVWEYRLMKAWNRADLNRAA